MPLPPVGCPRADAVVVSLEPGAENARGHLVTGGQLTPGQAENERSVMRS